MYGPPQVTFPYKHHQPARVEPGLEPTVDVEACAAEWLGHYGFVPQLDDTTHAPERDCAVVLLTLPVLRKALRAQPAEAPRQDDLRALKGARSRLAAAGLDQSAHAFVDGYGRIGQTLGLLCWLSVAAGGEPEDAASCNADLTAQRLLRAVLLTQASELAIAAEEAAAQGEATGGDGLAVQAVAAGAVRALLAATTTTEDERMEEERGSSRT